MGKEINIEASREDFFRKYVEIMRPVIKVSSKRHLDILALLLYYNDQKKAITDLQDRCKLIFDYDTRILIREKLDISDSVLNNALVALRKKRLIKGNNVLEQNILVYPDSEFEMSYKFRING